MSRDGHISEHGLQNELYHGLRDSDPLLFAKLENH